MNASIAPEPVAGGDQAGHIALRNTYALLACTLLSASFGAWVGINLRITEGLTGALAFLALLLGGFGFYLLLQRWRHSTAALLVLCAFMFFVGLMLSLALVKWLGFYTTGNTLMTAFASAAAMKSVAAMAVAVLKRALSPGVQVVLSIGALMLVAAVAAWLLRSSAQVVGLSVLAGGALGAVMLRERHRLERQERSEGMARSGPVAAIAGVFLSLSEGFQSLSALLGRADRPRI